MKISRLTLALAVAIFACFFSYIAYAQLQPTGMKIVLDGDIINPATSGFIAESIRRAERANSRFIMIELDTPGGLLGSTRDIVKSIMSSKVPVITYVSPMGARAGSAGVFITLASHIAAMAPSTNIGAARPVSVGGGPTKPGIFDQISGKLEKGSRTPEEEKVISDSKAWAESIAGERGRNPQWAATAVTDSASVSADEAKSLGIIDLIADDEQGLLSKIHGMRVRLADGERTIDTSGIKILEVEKDFRTRVLSAVAHPNIAYVLLILGFYGLLFEFTNPGIGFPGIAGSVCLVLAFFGLQVLPTNYAGIALLALAVAMFIAEVKVVSYGLLTIGGLISFFFGSTILFTSPDDFMKVSMPIILSFTVATLLLAGFLTALVLRARGRRPVTGSEGMMGLVGEVTSWNAGSGKVLVRGEIWNARSADTLKRGDEIEVVIAEGMNLLVELKKDS
ncbi:MAG TPA: nodulation protein NfeD [bacterium]|nr:nodulation protein NfeD [Myxococcales bacterium]OQA60943.1 MAG: hypothetical protein BWY40_00790 [bacterium ADurb.Bin270]HPW45842.1 nodulation protein NfeD [bacterium]